MARCAPLSLSLFVDGLCKREDLFIMTKAWNDMHGDGDILIALAKSLKDLKLDYVDMYFLHWPFPNYHAPHTVECDCGQRAKCIKSYRLYQCPTCGKKYTLSYGDYILIDEKGKKR